MSMNKEFNLNLVLEVISLQSNNILTTFNWKEGIKNKYDSWSRIIPSKNILRAHIQSKIILEKIPQHSIK